MLSMLGAVLSMIGITILLCGVTAVFMLVGSGEGQFGLDWLFVFLGIVLLNRAHHWFSLPWWGWILVGLGCIFVVKFVYRFLITYIIWAVFVSVLLASLEVNLVCDTFFTVETGGRVACFIVSLVLMVIFRLKFADYARKDAIEGNGFAKTSRLTTFESIDDKLHGKRKSGYQSLEFDTQNTNIEGDEPKQISTK